MLRDPTDEHVIPVVEELQRRLPPSNAFQFQVQGDGKEYQGQHDGEAEEDGKHFSSTNCNMFLTYNIFKRDMNYILHIPMCFLFSDLLFLHLNIVFLHIIN